MNADEVFYLKTRSTMSSLLKQIKSINQIERDIVIGYIKYEQKSLTIAVAPHEIPVEICYLCILYYYEYDCFNKDKCAEQMTIDDTNTIVTIQKSGGGFKKAFGAIDIFNKDNSMYSMIYSWTFKILNHKTDTPQVIYIGIDSDYKSKNPVSVNIVSYALGTDTRTVGFAMDNGKYIDVHSEWKYGKDDQIKMELNMSDKTLKYWINEQDIDCKVEGIDFEEDMKYNMCVCAALDGLSIQLVNFDKICCTK